MTVKAKINILVLLLIVAAETLPVPVSASGYHTNLSELPSQTDVFELNKTEAEELDVLRELYIEDFITLPIVQQPRGNLTFVSPVDNYLTEFQSASKFGTVGLLAHNYLAGRHFFQIIRGQEITLIYDNTSKKYAVTEIQQYQALAPESPTSDFIDLATGEQLTASQVFKRTYGSQPGSLVLQTCISANQNASWGRLFVIAQPADLTSIPD